MKGQQNTWQGRGCREIEGFALIFCLIFRPYTSFFIQISSQIGGIIGFSKLYLEEVLKLQEIAVLQAPCSPRKKWQIADSFAQWKECMEKHTLKLGMYLLQKRDPEVGAGIKNESRVHLRTNFIYLFVCFVKYE